MTDTARPKTLRDYLALAVVAYGQNSAAVKFIHDKIDESPNKGDEEVIADQYQMMYLLQEIHNKGVSDESASKG